MGIEETLAEILHRVKRLENDLCTARTELRAVGLVVAAYGIRETGLLPVPISYRNHELKPEEHRFQPAASPVYFRWEAATVTSAVSPRPDPEACPAPAGPPC